MKHQTTKRVVFRWIAFLAILFNVAFSNTYSYFSHYPDIKEVTQAYPAYFTPSAYAFSIWGLIYVVLMIYGIIQLFPSKKNCSIYDRLSIPVALVNVLCVVWIMAYTRNLIGISLLVIGVMLAVSSYLFIRSHRAVIYQNYNLWLRLPFCLLSAWLTIAAASNFFVYLKYTGWSANIGEGVLATMMIFLAVVIGFIISVRFSSLVFPAVIAWALVAIGVERHHDAATVASTAMVCAALLFIGSILAAVFKRVKVRKKINT